MKPALRSQLDELAKLRLSLGSKVRTHSRWMGSLRREVRASSIASSTSIEGFSVSPDDALALTDRPSLTDHDEENRQAVVCYGQAMDHVGTMAIDPSFQWTDRVILDLHFEACRFQRDRDPGLWRSGPIGVTGADGSLEYEGPDASRVPVLMDEIAEWLQHGDLEVDVVVRAAMAHLHVISVHPFRDGNGRISRIVQSLVLAREGLTAPEFFSIEEYLRHHTPEYYAALREAQGGSYQPERNTGGWVDFCVRAHLAQARQRLEQIEAAATRWERLEELVADRNWPDRLIVALEQSLVGGAERRRYSEEAGVSAATASADFRRLVDGGLIEQSGSGRSTRYFASEHLKHIRNKFG